MEGAVATVRFILAVTYFTVMLHIKTRTQDSYSHCCAFDVSIPILTSI